MTDSTVRLAGISHETILEWVRQGPGPAATERTEQRLSSAAAALAEASDRVNACLQRITGEWQGAAAETASGSMRTLRDFTDRMHDTSATSRANAFHQSDGSSFARREVPPKVELRPPTPTGWLGDVLANTEDFHDQVAAARQAEERAREVMRIYGDATAARLSGMTELPSAPRVVLDAGTTTTAAGPASTGAVITTGGPDTSRAPDDGGPSGERGDTGLRRTDSHSRSTVDEQGDGADPAPPAGQPATTPTTPSAIAPGQAPGSSAAPPAAAVPGSPGSPEPGRGPGIAPLSGLGPAGGRVAGGRHVPPRGGVPGTGRPPGAEPAPGRATGAAPRPGVGTGMAPLAGAGPRDKDDEHTKKYRLPSSDHFEPDDEDGTFRGAQPAGFHVAPEVIGEENEG